MNYLTKLGRLFYAIGLVAFGIQQFVIKDFRSELLSPFPAWAHEYAIFPILAGVGFLFAGIVISGVVRIKSINTRTVCLYLGFSFLALIITSHLPYILFFGPDQVSQLNVWFGAGEELCYAGGAFAIARSIPITDAHASAFTRALETLTPFARIFFCVIMVIFGSTHFLFPDFVSAMVPSWLGARMFWNYFVGAALIGSSIAIVLKIWLRPVALLLAIMLFLFFLFFHIPEAIKNPYTGGANEVVRTLVCLLFCGIALVIGGSKGQERTPTFGR